MLQNTPFINIHCHQKIEKPEYLQVLSLDIHQPVPENHRFLTMGFHPWEVQENEALFFDKLTQLLQQNLIIGIGECGLDKPSTTDFSIQSDIFEKQIELAKNYKKPLILHTVKAYNETLQLLAKNDHPAAIFHGFRKNIQLADQLLKKGFYLSLGTYILQQHNDDLIEHIPVDQLFLETDQDDPNRIEELYQYICTLKNMEIADLKIKLFQNFKNIFK